MANTNAVSSISAKCFLSAIGVIGLLFVFFLSIQNSNILHNCDVDVRHLIQRDGRNDTFLDFKVSNLKEMLLQLSTDIRKVKTHIRGTKARKHIVNALSVVTKLLDMTNTSSEGLTRKTTVSKHICREVFKGSHYGYPLYHKGFERENCTYATPLEDLVTIVFLHNKDQTLNITSVLDGITGYNNKIKVIVGTSNPDMLSEKDIFSNMQFLKITDKFSVGKAWNFLIGQVRTEYVLVARNMTCFSIDTRLERLVHEIESLDVSVVGGSSRDYDGFWKHGCYQVAYRNYTLVYEEGYDESLHECLFCDYLTSPFLIRTKTTKKYQFDEYLTISTVFNDFFLRLSQSDQESVVCPDSMFNVHRTELSNKPETWLDLADKHNLYRINFVGEVDIIFDCSNSNFKCNKKRGYAIHPCCLQELVNIMKFLMKLCEESDSFCEIDSGSIIGATKFYSVLPWEVDGDISFLYTNFTTLSNLKEKILKRYAFHKSNQFIQVDSKHWFVELFGMKLLDSEKLVTIGIKPTKVLLDGEWVRAPGNPGLWARNRYGHEIYAHAQHWRHFGKKSSWLDYKTNYFTPCETPGRHDCLDLINADGNLQFRIPIA